MLDSENEPDNSDSATQQTYMHSSVTGAINQHTPPYWRVLLPVLSARYLGRYIQTFNKLETRNFDAMAGALVLATTALFASRTAKDMRNIFAETVSYEFDKKPEEISVMDIMSSHNNTVISARNNFIFYNTLRTAVNSTFFASFLPGKSMQRFRETPSVDFGVGANGAYLAMEVLGRGRTFFEQVQNFVDLKLSAKNALGEAITSLELMQLYQRNAVDNDKASIFDAKTDPDVIRNSRIIFERMADLMNQTYMNKHMGDKDNFTLPKFLYLIGYNLIQPTNVKQSLMYVEIANAYGMNALKHAVQESKNGVAIEDILKQYPVTINDPVSASVSSIPKIAGGKKFSESVITKNSGYLGLASIPEKKEGESFVSRIKDTQLGPLQPN